MDKESSENLKKKGIDDEICTCGHSKAYHQAHQLDKHGAGCELCDCTLYCWGKFIKYVEV